MKKDLTMECTKNNNLPVSGGWPSARTGCNNAKIEVKESILEI